MPIHYDYQVYDRIYQCIIIYHNLVLFKSILADELTLSMKTNNILAKRRHQMVTICIYSVASVLCHEDNRRTKILWRASLVKCV